MCLSLYEYISPRPAVLHLHEALVGVGLVVGAAHGVVVGGADAAAAGEDELEVLQAVGHRRHVHVAAGDRAKFYIFAAAIKELNLRPR